MIVLAHRGGDGPWRENILEAFAGALRLGADGVELDVRLSADGELVVHHDAEVPGSGLIHERRYDAAPGVGPDPRRGPGSVRRVRRQRRDQEHPDRAVDTTPRTGVGGGRRGAGQSGARAGPWPAHVVVSSFWPDALAAAGGSRRRGALGLLVHPALDAVAALDTAETLRVRGPAPPSLAGGRPSWSSAAHERGLAVVTWTVNSPEEIDAVVEAGVDVVITDSVAAHPGPPGSSLSKPATGPDPSGTGTGARGLVEGRGSREQSTP